MAAYGVLEELYVYWEDFCQASKAHSLLYYLALFVH